jgi:hypothetical protein
MILVLKSCLESLLAGNILLTAPEGNLRMAFLALLLPVLEPKVGYPAGLRNFYRIMKDEWRAWGGSNTRPTDSKSAALSI